MSNMLEVKVLGRGGFGVVSSAQILGRVFLELGFWATSIPRFGAERRGAPVHADVRVSSNKIRIKSFIEKGDLTVVLDQNAFQVQEIISYSKPMGVVVINSSVTDKYESYKNKRKLVFVEGTKLSLSKFDSPFSNIIILGSIFKLLGITDLELITKKVLISLPSLEEQQVNQMLELGSSLTNILDRLRITVEQSDKNVV